LNRIKANERRRKKEERKKEKRRTLLNRKMQQFRKAMISFAFSLSLGLLLSLSSRGEEEEDWTVIHSASCALFISPASRTDDFSGERGASQGLYLSPPWRAQLSAQSSLHYYYYYLTTMSVIRFSEGREKKKKEKTGLDMFPFFSSFPHKPSSII
jgi:hypothetical protein